MANHPSVAALPQAPAVYMLTNLVNGKRYVGQARNLRTRWYWHRNAACGAAGSSYAQKTAIARAMRKYGVQSFSLTVLEYCAEASLDGREIYWIAERKTTSPAGYNLTAGGSRGARSPEVGAKISAANKGRVKTPEWRAKLSAAHKGKKLSPEHCRKISEVQKGRKHSAESRLKRSLATKGVKRGPYSPERCAAIASGMTAEGRLRSIAGSTKPEVIARRAATATGQKRTVEQCAHISESQRVKWSAVPKDERRAYMRALVSKRKTWSPSEETRQKISATLKRRHAEASAHHGA